MTWKQDTMEREALEALQLKRLKDLVKRVYENVPFYQKALDERGFKPSDVTSLDDLRKLPITNKDALRQNYPFGMFATPMSEVAEIHVSSGTTGNPTVVGYSRNDIDVWSEVMARTIACAGGTRDDVVQNAYGYGLFTGGLGVHYGALALGAAVIPMSSGGTKRQLKLMKDFGATIITCTPSYALYMAETARELGIDPAESSWRIGIFGAEPWTDGMRREIEKAWNLLATDVYGLSEIIGPGVAQECPAKDGLHIWADHFLPEILDPDTYEPVAEGESGVLTITTLTKEAMPLLRYATGDIVSITYAPCDGCGRTMPRISKIKGRTDDMLIIRGINVFPSQIESVLLEIEGAQPHYQLVVTREHNLDQLEVWVEVDERFFTDEIRGLELLERKVREEIQNTLRLSARVKLVEPKTIQRSEGKAKRVIDRREL
ncbi:MAG: phenylacetate--CoA ligase [Candidatus Latescibacteria bacterium]|nr:phenylacetate--CoA ligase [Candidatus Latescibacterota bacterium]